ncbi:MAG: hypothetical protein ACXADA_22245 [Candidatus Hodarchaeales archaeon]
MEPLILYVLAGVSGGVIAILLLEKLLRIFGPNLFWGAPFVMDVNGWSSRGLIKRTTVAEILKVE